MNKTEWTKTFENAQRSSRVWRQHVNGHDGENLFTFPTSGSLDVIFVEVVSSSESFAEDVCHPIGCVKPHISDFIGYGRYFHPEYRRNMFF